MLFKSGYFYFNNGNSRQYNLQLTSMDVEESNIRNLGINRTANFINSYLKDAEESSVELNLTFKLVDVVKPSERLIEDISKWFFRPIEPQAFREEFGSIQYYLMFTGCEYLSQEMCFKCKAISMPYSYSLITISKFILGGVNISEKVVEVKSKDVKGECYPIIDIYSVTDNSLKIESNNQVIDVDIKANEIINIDTLSGEVISNNNIQVYDRVNINDGFKFKYGNNIIKISKSKSGRVDTFFKYQDRLVFGTR